MGTKIYITPPGGVQQEIKVYSKCSVTLSGTTRAGSFSLELPDTTGDLVDAFPVGSDVLILQDDNIFRGWVLNPPKIRRDKVIYITIEGMDYTARTQKILVTESYVGTSIHGIVLDLFAKYAPWADTSDVMPCDKLITIKLNDVFLFDALEKLAKIAGYQWFINAKLPEEIPSGEPSGWSELIELVAPAQWMEGAGWAEEITHRFITCSVPSEDLYPSEGLYPC